MPAKTAQENRNQQSRSRFEPQPQGGFRLEARDVQLLADLCLHRALSRQHLIALGYFGSVARCNLRLRQLFDRAYVRRFFLPEAPYGAQAVYVLGPAAIPAVTAYLGRDREEIQESVRRGTPTFLAHCLAVVDFRIALQRSVAQQEDVSIERWLPEVLCRHEYEVQRGHGEDGWRTEVFRPDAFVRLALTGGKAYRHYFVEIDRGHTSRSQFIGKLRAHRCYLETGLFAEVYVTCPEDTFATLVVTTGAARLSNLRQLAEEEGEALFWFTTFEAVARDGALASIWYVPFEDTPRNLL